MKKLKIDVREMPWLPEEIEYYDKYNSKNPMAKYLLNGFMKALNGLIDMADASVIHEIGCGEGDLCVALAQRKKIVRGTDLSTELLQRAEAKARERLLDISFRKVSPVMQ